MARRRSGYVQIDVSEILQEVDDDDLLEEVASRKLIASVGGAYEQDLVREAFSELRIGRVLEALTILDRLLNPKWRTEKDCLTAYVKTQGKMI